MINSEHLRPISVYSIFWYVGKVGSSVVVESNQTGPGSWRRQRSCEDVAAKALDDYHSKQYAGSLDCSMVFDHLEPRLATYTMARLMASTKTCATYFWTTGDTDTSKG